MGSMLKKSLVRPLASAFSRDSGLRRRTEPWAMAFLYVRALKIIP